MGRFGGEATRSFVSMLTEPHRLFSIQQLNKRPFSCCARWPINHPNSKGTSLFNTTLSCRHQHCPSMASPPGDLYHLAVFSFAHSPVTPTLTAHQVIPHHSVSAEPVWPLAPQLQCSISSSQSHRRLLLSLRPVSFSEAGGRVLIPQLHISAGNANRPVEGSWPAHHPLGPHNFNPACAGRRLSIHIGRLQS